MLTTVILITAAFVVGLAGVVAGWQAHAIRLERARALGQLDTNPPDMHRFVPSASPTEGPPRYDYPEDRP